MSGGVNMDIIGNGPMFRDAADFAADAEKRQWLESTRGQRELEARRIYGERLHAACMIISAEYRADQEALERALQGDSTAARLTFVSQRKALLGHD